MRLGYSSESEFVDVQVFEPSAVVVKEKLDSSISEQEVDVLIKSLQSGIKKSREPLEKAQILRLMGEAYEKLGDKPNALKRYQQALENDPKVGVKRKVTKLTKEVN